MPSIKSKAHLSVASVQEVAFIFSKHEQTVRMAIFKNRIKARGFNEALPANLSLAGKMYVIDLASCLDYWGEDSFSVERFNEIMGVSGNG